jgi:hypothetical protein
MMLVVLDQVDFTSLRFAICGILFLASTDAFARGQAGDPTYREEVIHVNCDFGFVHIRRGARRRAAAAAFMA